MQVFGDMTDTRRVRVRNDDAQIDVQMDGESGDAIVLLAGFPLTRAIWDAQAKALSQRYHVIRPDLRGMGASSVPNGPYLMEILAGDVAAVLDALGIERAAIVGHSLGGFVAMAFARMYAERLSHLALVTSRLSADSPEMVNTRYTLANEMEERQSLEPVVQWYLPRMLAGETQGVLYERVREIMNAIDYRGAAAMLRGMAVRDSGDDIAPDLDLPVLVVAGGRDSFVPPQAARETAAAFPDAQTVIGESSAHLPMLQEPGVVTEALRKLMER